MIHLTRLNHSEIVLNSDLIEHIEATPDTVITLTNGEKIVVLESTDEIVSRVVTFRRSITCSDRVEVKPQSESISSQFASRGK